MTITVTCQHTGFGFEAESKRSKNHPAVAKLLDEAAKNKHQRGANRQVKAMLAEARQSGEYETAEELVADVTAAYREWCQSPEAQVTVKSSRQRQAAGRAAIREMERMRPGLQEEYDDYTPPQLQGR